MTRHIKIQKNTVFAFGEGESELVFLKYLKSVYSCEKTSVTVRHAGGKDVAYILEKAIRVRGGGSFNHSFILLDTDRGLPEELRMELIGSTPCLEGMLLSILEPQSNHVTRSSGDCKKYFIKNYIGADRIITSKDCEKYFSKTILDKAKISNPTLKRIVDIMEGNY